MNNPKVSVISVTTYPTNFIMFQVPSVLLQRNVEFEYVIVDTTQYKETTSVISNHYQDDRIKFSPFQKSVCNVSSMKNAGAEFANGDYFLITEDNVTFTSYFLSDCIDKIKPNKYLGIDLNVNLNEDKERTFNNYSLTFISKEDFFEFGWFENELDNRFESAFTYQHKLQKSPLNRLDFPTGAVRIPDSSISDHICDNCEYIYGNREYKSPQQFIR